MGELKDIVLGCKKNNRDSQRELYRLFAPKLIVICLRYASSRQDAEDILHDAFIKIFESIGQLKKNQSAYSWAKRIMVNTSIDFLKKQMTFEDILESTEGMNIDYESHDSPSSNVVLSELLKAIERLPLKRKLVFNLRELDNFSFAEIAKKLDMSEGGVRSTLSDAKKQLKTICEEMNISFE